jgi:hypothetical protein
MAFRFQKRIKLLPGVTLNLSRKGASTSFGATGARVTVGHGQVRTTLGVPGTGISQTSITSTPKAQGETQESAPMPATKSPPNRGTGIGYAIGRFIGKIFLK